MRIGIHRRLNLLDSKEDNCNISDDTNSEFGGKDMAVTHGPYPVFRSGRLDTDFSGTDLREKNSSPMFGTAP